MLAVLSVMYENETLDVTVSPDVVTTTSADPEVCAEVTHVMEL